MLRRAGIRTRLRRRVADHDDAFQARDSCRGRLDRGTQLGADEKQTRATVVEHVGEFVADESPVDDGGHGADRRGGEQDFQAGRVILVQECHALAPLHAGGLQRSGRAPNPRRPLRPGPLPVAVANRYALGPLLGVSLGESGERLRRAGRGVGWWHNPSADVSLFHSVIRGHSPAGDGGPQFRLRAGPVDAVGTLDAATHRDSPRGVPT